MTNEKNEIKIRISGLSNGVHEYYFTVQPADLSLTGDFVAPVTIDIRLDKTAGQIYLRVENSATGMFPCDRCLGQFKRPVTSQCSLFYVFSELDSGKFPAEEVRIISPDSMCIDITDDVRQSILLAVPLKILCREDCRGLCPHCGTNWNLAACECSESSETDPRWESLKKIL